MPSSRQIALQLAMSAQILTRTTSTGIGVSSMARMSTGTRIRTQQPRMIGGIKRMSRLNLKAKINRSGFKMILATRPPS